MFGNFHCVYNSLGVFIKFYILYFRLNTTTSNKLTIISGSTRRINSALWTRFADFLSLSRVKRN